MTRTVVLAFTAQPGLTRLRIAWACNGTSLLVDIRDQDSGGLEIPALRHQLLGRAQTLGATIDIETLPGWGSHVTIELPLDPPAARPDEDRLTTLNRRERQVLALITRGKRNKAIAAELGITESTVKFHVGGVLKKLEVSSRNEAAVIGLSAGIVTTDAR